MIPPRWRALCDPGSARLHDVAVRVTLAPPARAPAGVAGCLHVRNAIGRGLRMLPSRPRRGGASSLGHAPDPGDRRRERDELGPAGSPLRRPEMPNQGPSGPRPSRSRPHARPPRGRDDRPHLLDPAILGRDRPAPARPQPHSRRLGPRTPAARRLARGSKLVVRADPGLDSPARPLRAIPSGRPAPATTKSLRPWTRCHASARIAHSPSGHRRVTHARAAGRRATAPRLHRCLRRDLRLHKSSSIRGIP